MTRITDRLPLSPIHNTKTTTNVFKPYAKCKLAAREMESNVTKLECRQRQIDIGKNTEGYKNYINDITRKERTKDHPWTPNKFTVCSTRSWQGVMRIWRRKLHFWDVPKKGSDVSAGGPSTDFSSGPSAKNAEETSPSINSNVIPAVDGALHSSKPQQNSINFSKTLQQPIGIDHQTMSTIFASNAKDYLSNYLYSSSNTQPSFGNYHNTSKTTFQSTADKHCSSVIKHKENYYHSNSNIKETVETSYHSTLSYETAGKYRTTINQQTTGNYNDDSAFHLQQSIVDYLYDDEELW